jgi:hypothetical protein
MLIGHDEAINQVAHRLHVPDSDRHLRRRDPRNYRAVEELAVPGRNVSLRSSVDIDVQILEAEIVQQRRDCDVGRNGVRAMRIVAFVEVPLQTVVDLVPADRLRQRSRKLGRRCALLLSWSLRHDPLPLRNACIVDLDGRGAS